MYLQKVITADGQLQEWAYCVSGEHACKLAEAKHPGHTFTKVYARKYDHRSDKDRELMRIALGP